MLTRDENLTRPLPFALLKLEAWLETMRGPGGYGGPVVHWWQQSFGYTGPGMDWRYEGIIEGYLQLWERTGQVRWLEKARRAGNDLLIGHLADGHFSNSSFEFNPQSGGTPHEAACDIGLLRLALALRQVSDSDWGLYAACAEQNLRTFYIAQLWQPQSVCFNDSVVLPSFVPNKAATVCEALFLMSELSGEASWVEIYALPTLERIMAHQAGPEAGRLAGGIAQNSFGRRIIQKYFPLYVARCIPALLEGYKWSGQTKYLNSAMSGMKFITGWLYPDGSLPTVVYPGARLNHYPTWIAPLAEILRVADLLKPYGFEADLSQMLGYLLAGQDASGGVQTARGFAVQASLWPRHPDPALPDVRDLLHVVGWCDKAFRFLSTQLTVNSKQYAVDNFEPGTLNLELDCSFRGKRLRLVETPTRLEIWRAKEIRYAWDKGTIWAKTIAPEFWLR